MSVLLLVSHEEQEFVLSATKAALTEKVLVVTGTLVKYCGLPVAA